MGLKLVSSLYSLITSLSCTEEDGGQIAAIMAVV